MKEPEKFYKIGEIIEHTKLSRQTIHNYTVLGLIKEKKRTKSGHRLYGADVFEAIEKIERLKRHRTLTEVKEQLERERQEEIH